MSECDKCNGWGVDDVTGFACPSCQTVKQTLTVEPVSNPDGLAAAMQADAAPVVDHPPTSNPVDDSETGNTSDKPDTTPAAHDITDADRRATLDVVGLLRNPGPSDVLHAEAVALVKTGDYRGAWFKMCQALPMRAVEAHRQRELDEAGVIDLAREAFKAGFDLASAATYRGGWEQAWEWSKISDKVAALKSPT